MKVYEARGYQYKQTPSIVLKGKWLSELGFNIGEQIEVKCEDGRLIITKANGNLLKVYFWNILHEISLFRYCLVMICKSLEEDWIKVSLFGCSFITVLLHVRHELFYAFFYFIRTGHLYV